MSGIKLTEKQKDDLDKLTIAIEREESLTENYHDKVHSYIMKYVNNFRVANGANSENANCAIFDVSGSLPDYVDCMDKAFELADKLEEVEEIGGHILHVYENDIAKLVDYCRGKGNDR